MTDQATTIPPSGLGKIRLKDLWRGLYYAAITQVVALVSFFITNVLQEHPHLPTWPEWLPYVKATVYAIGGYLVGKLGINNVGQILKPDQPVVKVDAAQLDELQNEKKNL